MAYIAVAYIVVDANMWMRTYVVMAYIVIAYTVVDANMWMQTYDTRL